MKRFPYGSFASIYIFPCWTTLFDVTSFVTSHRHRTTIFLDGYCAATLAEIDNSLCRRTTKFCIPFEKFPSRVLCISRVEKSLEAVKRLVASIVSCEDSVAYERMDRELFKFEIQSHRMREEKLRKTPCPCVYLYWSGFKITRPDTRRAVKPR